MEGSALLADAVIGDNFWRSLTLDRQAPPRAGTTPCNYDGSISSLCPTSIPVLALNHDSLLELKISPAFDITYPKGQSRKEKAFLLASKIANLSKFHDYRSTCSLILMATFNMLLLLVYLAEIIIILNLGPGSDFRFELWPDF